MSRAATRDRTAPAGLPPALRDWAPAFETMPEAQLRVLGRLMEAIAPLVETVERALRSGIEEFDGYDGVAAAGRLERALASELVWRELAPVEFIRRVAEGELLRHDPVHRDRSDDRAVVALFDCGPRILGRRRLVALAALLCLAVAARRRSARLFWCSTGFEPAEAWREGLDRRGLAMFVQRTGVSGLSPGLAERLWEAAPDAARAAGTAVWAIGPRGFALDARGALNRLDIDEAGVWRGERWIAEGEAALTAAAGLRRVERFVYPEESACADLLRAPFRPPARMRPPGEGWAPRWLSASTDDHGVLARLEDGVLCFRRGEPDWLLELGSERALMGLRWLTDGPRAVLWRDGGRLMAAQIDQTGEVFWRGEALLASDHKLVVQSHAPEALPGLIRGAGRRRLLAAAPDGALFEIGFGDPTGALLVEPARKLEDFRLHARRGAWMLGRRAGDPPGRYWAIHARKDRRIALWAGDGEAALRGVRVFWPLHDRGLGALVCDRSGWRWLSCRERPPWLTPPPADHDAAPIAVWELGGAASRAASQGVVRAQFWSPRGGLVEAKLFLTGEWTLAPRGETTPVAADACVAAGDWVFAADIAETGALHRMKGIGGQTLETVELAELREAARRATL